MREVLAERIADLLAEARAEGRKALSEFEGLRIVRALGIRTPRHVAVDNEEDVAVVDLDAFEGPQIVLKIVSHTLLHKSDVGGVRFLDKDVEVIQQTIRALRRDLPPEDVEGFIIAEFVPHDPSLGGQLLVGMRWTPDFGPVVTLGPGGVHAEFLARNLRPERSVAILSPLLASPEHIDAALERTAITPAVTGRLRGQASIVTLEDLRALVQRLLDFAEETMPDDILEFEINPLVWTRDGPVALDALVKLGEPGFTEPTPRPLAKVARLLRPRSIGIIGVSRGTNPGRIMLKNILRQGFERDDIVVVKPGVPSIEGCVCVPDVASMPGKVDLFVVCVDAQQVPGVIEDLTRHHKAESVILIAGGLGERRGTETHAERVIDAIERSRRERDEGPVLNGGNCLGVRSVPGKYDTLFIPEHKLQYPAGRCTPLAMVAQSGAFAVARASKLSSLNPRYLVTLGNQLDLTVGDYLTRLKDDPKVEVFACYVEGFKPGDGRRWLEAAADITASGRTVILYRAGRTPAGAAATASHTASVAGDYAVTRALAASAGAVVAESLEDFDDLVRLFCLLRQKEVAGWRLGALSNAGFEVVAMADNLGPFQLASFDPSTRDRLAELLAEKQLEEIVGVRNLLDLTPIVDDEAYEDSVRLVLGDPNVDVGVIGCVPLTGALQTTQAGAGHAEDFADDASIVRRLIRFHALSTKAWVGVVDAGPLYDPMVKLMQEEGVPVFRTADRALRLFGTYCDWRLRYASA